MTGIFDLTGKVALVTGASSGLGAQFAKALAQHGADVAIIARRVEKLAETKKAVEALGKSCLAIKCDVTKMADIVNAVNETVEVFGTIDILINSAGVGISAPAESQTEEEWRRVIETNLNATYFFCREAGKIMIGKKYDKIINIGSIHSNVGIMASDLTAYCASKGGVQMLTKQLAIEWAEYNITVNAIGPSYFLSEMTERVQNDPGFKHVLETYCPMKRFGKPEELDGTIVYLASDASNFVTGHMLNVDGGWLAI